ncbi:hypothetical protein DPMN_098825 [Dreissena polymorpha]|uniref:TIR domain-containing protein n=1 Tax=Dreissena polymorpha TaxID=45954 RepID=A0A9D4LG02_DREPO|nr:hypothetical protein DPMN_098825 [Dreissena polymorpha]
MHILAILNPLPAEIGNYQVRLKNTEGEATASADLTLVDSSKPKAGHIMLSYNKFSKEMVLRIYKELQGNGFKVWIDIYDMKGDTFDAMAEAVEDASIFIMCMSSGYQESKNCEKEAKFAETLGKTIIPLKLEKDFSPRRWLGLILGTKMFFDFSGKYPIEGKMKELLQEIERKYKS